MGFGKTTNMDMIRRFYEIQVDEDGGFVARNNTKYFKIFASSYLKNRIPSHLDVYEDKTFFNAFFAQYPIIHVDFTQLDFKSWSKFKESLVKIINELFNYHSYLLSSVKLSDKEKVMFRNYQFSVICRELEPVQLKESVTFLASMLYKYFNQKVILLIDEIDSIIHGQLMNISDNTEEIITFIADLVKHTLNSNLIAKTVINASSRFCRVFTKGVGKINHFIHSEKHSFNKCYGFTEADVINLAEIFGLKNNLTAIQVWYNGYKIPKSDLKMYSFHSISNVMFRKDIDIYSKKGKNPKKLEKLFLNKGIRRKVKTLIKNGVISIAAVKEITVKDILRLKEIFNQDSYTDLCSRDESLIFDYMLNLGYLTVVDLIENCSIMTLKIPNMESKSELLDLVYSMPYFKTKLNLTDEEILTVNETFLDSKMSKFLEEPVLTSSHYI